MLLPTTIATMLTPITMMVMPIAAMAIQTTAMLLSLSLRIFGHSILWQENKLGIAGRKAARLFTSEEGGRVKYSYHKRKIAWDMIDQLIRAGYTAQTAINKIYLA